MELLAWDLSLAAFAIFSLLCHHMYHRISDSRLHSVKLMRRNYVSLNTEGAIASIINVPDYINDKRRSMKRVSQ